MSCIPSRRSRLRSLATFQSERIVCDVMGEDDGGAAGRCGEKTRSGAPCQLRAGFGVPSVLRGPCMHHIDVATSRKNESDDISSAGLDAAVIRTKDPLVETGASAIDQHSARSGTDGHRRWVRDAAVVGTVIAVILAGAQILTAWYLDTRSTEANRNVAREVAPDTERGSRSPPRRSGP